MSLSVKFNDIELNQYIDVTQGFTPFVGANWNPEINTSADNVLGAVFQYTAYKEKTIHMPFRVKYNIEEKYDALQKILNVDEPKPLIFSNMPNKVFYAIPSGALDFEEIVFLGKGEINWIIPDGVAHSVDIVQVKAAAENGILTAHVDNDSSAAVYPIYRIKHVTENGYLGIVHPGGAFEMGNREEADTETYQQSEVLTKGMSDYVAYTGTNPKNPAILNNGTLNLASDGYLRLSSQGSGTHWHGGSRKWDLPADSNGEVGAKNFYLWFRLQFMTGLIAQTGLIQVMLTDASNNLIAAFEVHKDDMVGNKAYAQAWVGGNSIREAFRWDFTPTIYEKDNSFIYSKGYEDILKIGSKIRFFYYGKYYEINVPELANVKVASVQVFIGQYASWGKLVTVMGVGELRGRKDYVNKLRDIPNRYAAGSEIVIDTESDSITVDGLPANDELVDGSEFSVFPVGETDIEFYTSSWCKSLPMVSVEYRKRWL